MDDLVLGAKRLSAGSSRSSSTRPCGERPGSSRNPARVQAILHRPADLKVIGRVLAQNVSSWTTAGGVPLSAEFGLKRLAWQC
ncbi:hypothetical protein DMP23_19085 [Amycolatopsis sp. A1MSW2902]